MPDILDEAEEEYRAERAQALLARYGWVLGLAALGVVGGLGGREGWRWYQQKQATAAAESYLAAGAAAAAPNADLAAIAGRYEALAAAAPDGYRVLAQLRGAALLAEAGKREAALAAWDGLAHDARIDPLYRDLATLYWALHGMDEGPGAIDPATLESRLAPLADGPWKASIAELRGLIALRRGDAAAARRLLAPLLVDPAAPAGMRERVQRLLAGIAA